MRLLKGQGGDETGQKVKRIPVRDHALLKGRERMGVGGGAVNVRL